MTEYRDFRSTEHRFISQECAATILHALYDTVDALEVFPDKAAYSWVFRDCLEIAIGKDIAQSRSIDRDVIDISYGSVGNLGLQDVSYVVMKDRHGTGLAHGKYRESKGTEGGLEGGKIS